MRYALLVEYEGTCFHGSQLQSGVRTVQGELELALGRVYGHNPRIWMASRTDAGVHATGQVAAFDQDERHAPATLRDALNFHLPDDVSITAVERVSPGFDPRRNALQREYIYTLNDGPAPSAIGRRHETRTRRLTNLDAMEEAAGRLVGTHDFASFAGPATPADASTTRDLRRVEVKRTSENRCVVTVAANAFLHQQVRRMTGALVRVGCGKMSVDELAGLVEHPVRGAAGWPLAPPGLSLRRIEYGNEGPFASESEYN